MREAPSSSTSPARISALATATSSSSFSTRAFSMSANVAMRSPFLEPSMALPSAVLCPRGRVPGPGAPDNRLQARTGGAPAQLAFHLAGIRQEHRRIARTAATLHMRDGLAPHALDHGHDLAH